MPKPGVKAWLAKVFRIKLKGDSAALTGGAISSDDDAAVEAELAPVMAMSSPKPGDAGHGRYVAEGVAARWIEVRDAQPYAPLLEGLNTAFAALDGLPDSRIGRAAAAPLQAFFTAMVAHSRALDGAGATLVAAVANKSTADKALLSAARAVEARLTDLDNDCIGMANAVGTAVASLQGDLDKQAKANVARNFSNLHPEVVAFFDNADKAQKVVTQIVGVVSTAAGHPHIGLAVKAALSGALSGARGCLSFILTTLDKRDRGTVEEATPFLPKDRSDVLTIDNVKTAAGYAKTAATQLTKGLSFIGIDLDILAELTGALEPLKREILALNAQATAICRDAIAEVGGEVREMAHTGVSGSGAGAAAGGVGVDLDAEVDKAVTKGITKANAKLDAIKTQIQAKLAVAGPKVAAAAMKSIEDKLRGVRSEENLDIDGAIAALEGVGAGSR